MTETTSARRHPLFNGWMALGVGAAFLFGVSIDYIFARIYNTGAPLRSYHLIAGSLAVDFAGLAVLLALLPGREQFARRLPWLTAWGHAELLGTAAFAGMAVAPVHAEPARTFVALAVLFTAQAALATALHALLTTILFPRELIARQLLLLFMSALITTLFWTRGVIRGCEQSSQTDGAHRAEVVADGVMKLSPPTAVCAAWYVESNAGIHQTPGLFDLVHSPLTYGEWLGVTGKQVAYPDILPPALRSNSLEYEHENTGLAAALLAWSLPLIVLCDILLRKRQRHPTSL